MSNYILEGEAFFILEKLYDLTEGKKIEINPEDPKIILTVRGVGYKAGVPGNSQ